MLCCRLGSIKKLRLGRAVLVLLPIALFSRSVRAQADVLRGRITGDSGAAVAGAAVVATSVSGGLARKAMTGADGRYTITVPNGDGDYWVDVTAIGYAPRRVEIRRVLDEQILIADVRLSRGGVALDPVRVRSSRRMPAPDSGGTDVGGAEMRIATDAATAEQLANLALLAATVPGVQLIPAADGSVAGFSVFGLANDQNTTTLNGMRVDLGSLPRDAAFDASVATSPYDVSRGGFSGAQLALRSRPPSNLTLRANSLAFDAPWLQWTDPAGRALGQDFGSVSVGGVFTSPIERDHAFAHIAYQAARRFSAMRTLVNTDAAGLQALGLAPDSVQRLLTIAQRLGIPSSVAGIPGQRLTEQGLVYGNVDLLGAGGASRALDVTFAANWNRQTPSALAVGSIPSHAGRRDFAQGVVQVQHTGSFGPGVLSETQAGIGASASGATRYLNLPDASILINSMLPDGSASVGRASVGGSQYLDQSQSAVNLSMANHLSWFSDDNAHRIMLTSELTVDRLREALAANRLGAFRFNSLSDFENGVPASFERQLASPRHDISIYTAGLALGDAYTPVDNLQLNYGLRVDANRFGGGPAMNPRVEQTFGVRNDGVPDRVRFSPRAGFAYHRADARRAAALEGGARDAGMTLRGGIGVFQGLPSVGLPGQALDHTGLPSAEQQLTCSGSAVPRPDWSAYRATTAAIPSTCADGSGPTAFADDQPNVVLFAPGYSSPRSVRSNLQWSAPVADGRLNARAELSYSLNLNQPGSVDLNFDGTPRFALGAEADRPVYVEPSSIVPETGVPFNRDARRSDAFGHVTELRSDLRSEAKQLVLSLAPAGFHSAVNWSVAYVYSNIREQLYGFANTDGDPSSRGWARSSFDSRHQIVYTVGYDLLDLFRLTWTGSVRSGAPFTPMVSGDVNGDGLENDRAFIFSPAAADSTTAARMRAVIDGAPSSVRRCLTSQEGRVAARNSCEGPWASTAALTIGFNPVRWWRSNRVDVQFQIANPLGAADLVANGAGHLRGWGQVPIPDATLLYVRGFDPGARRFSYDVNPRFGSTAPALTTLRAPVIATAIVRVDVGPTREKQTLIQQLDRGRRTPGTRLSEAALKALYGTSSVFNPMAAILRVADSIGLDARAADSITVLNAAFLRKTEQIWTPVARDLAALPADYDDGAAYALYLRGRRATIDALVELGPIVERVLTSEQRRRLPAYLLAHLDPRYLATIRSGTAGLGLAFLPGVSAPRTSGSGAGIATVR